MANIGMMGDFFSTWGGGIDFLSLLSRSIDKDHHRFMIILPKKQGNIAINMMANTFAFLQYQRISKISSIQDYYYQMILRKNRDYQGQDKLLSTLKNYHSDL